MVSRKFPVGSERKFNEFLVSEYLRYGSVDEVLKKHKFDIPISYAQYHRVLDKWGIVKAAGPNNKLSEILTFMMKMVEESKTVEELYKKMPPSFQTSLTTLYRIATYMKEGITRRLATGLVITPYRNAYRILVGNDVSTPRVEYGKPYGAISIPMGFSKNRDSRHDSILRVLQQEVFTDIAISKKLPENIIPRYPRPFLFLDIADIRVEIYHLKLPRKLSKKSFFSSFKLTNHRFEPVSKIIGAKNVKVEYRVGMAEVVKAFQKHQRMKARGLKFNPLQRVSVLNEDLILALDLSP